MLVYLTYPNCPTDFSQMLGPLLNKVSYLNISTVMMHILLVNCYMLFVLTERLALEAKRGSFPHLCNKEREDQAQSKHSRPLISIR